MTTEKEIEELKNKYNSNVKKIDELEKEQISIFKEQNQINDRMNELQNKIKIYPIIEKEKRSKSGKEYWENCSEEDKMNRTSNQVNTMITKAGLTKELIYEIRKLHSSGIKPKILKEKYSDLTEKQINNIIDKRKWKTIYEY